jgi:hypothetical protein
MSVTKRGITTKIIPIEDAKKHKHAEQQTIRAVTIEPHTHTLYTGYKKKLDDDDDAMAVCGIEKEKSNGGLGDVDNLYEMFCIYLLLKHLHSMFIASSTTSSSHRDRRHRHRSTPTKHINEQHKERVSSSSRSKSKPSSKSTHSHHAACRNRNHHHHSTSSSRHHSSDGGSGNSSKMTTQMQTMVCF